MNNSLFSKEELARYNRHIIIPEFGPAAQSKLKESSVLVVGAGGLGSPLLLYLAAAGVGHIGIVDCDVVEDSNLQRQVLFGVQEIGLPKAKSAKERLQSLNPYIKITEFNVQFTAQNAMEIAKYFDVVADGTDNFPTRYLVNDTCVFLDKPNVYASIYQFEGNVSVFNYVDKEGNRGPNYRDLFPVPPLAETVTNCSEAGVLGVLPGIIGSMQALEVIKVITGVGETLTGKFYTFDALTFESRTFNVKRDPANPLNGDHPTIDKLVDYEQFCGSRAIQSSLKNVSASELYDWKLQKMDIQIIDVREAYEYEIVNIDSTLISLSVLTEHLHQIDQTKKVIVLCKSGVRSAKAIALLQDKYGYKNLYNLEGGIINYINELQLNLPVY
jgi:molybdopterin/thiamine biosynthesis adenylyltransferase/rhodanese-related sulfurtransferase